LSEQRPVVIRRPRVAETNKKTRPIIPPGAVSSTVPQRRAGATLCRGGYPEARAGLFKDDPRRTTRWCLHALHRLEHGRLAGASTDRVRFSMSGALRKIGSRTFRIKRATRPRSIIYAAISSLSVAVEQPQPPPFAVPLVQTATTGELERKIRQALAILPDG
jgi:hypothetical protein